MSEGYSYTYYRLESTDFAKEVPTSRNCSAFGDFCFFLAETILEYIEMYWKSEAEYWGSLGFNIFQSLSNFNTLLIQYWK